MRIPSGVTDQYIYFVAVDSADLKTRETGLTTFTVYRSRNGAAAAAMTTPTVNETDSINMEGVYELLLDEDMTIAAGNDTEEMVFHITQASMAPVTRTIELYRSKITAGYTLGVESDGDLTKVNTLDGHTAQTGDNYARLGAPAGASVSADIATVDSNVDTILTDTNELQTNQGDWATATGFSTHSAADAADSVWDEAKAGHVAAGSFGEEVQAHALSTEVDSVPTAAENRTEMDSNSTQLAAIVADTNELQTDDVPGLIAALNDVSTAEVNAEVDTALSDIHLDHLLAVDYDPASKPGTATALLNEIVENDGGVSRFTANALEQAPSAGTNPNVLVDTTAATVASQTSLTLTAGSNDDDAYNDQAIVIYDASDSDYPSVRKVSDYTGSTRTVTLDSGPDFTMIAGDGVKIFVTAPGSTAPTAAENRIEMDSNSTQLAAIVADSNELQTDWANGGRLDLIIDAILADTGELQTDWVDGGRLDLLIDAILADTAEIGAAGAGLSAVPWNASWDAEVQSEVNDALVALHLDHLLSVDYDPASKPGTATALLNELVESDGGVSRFTANALEEAPSGGGSLTADQVWDESMDAAAPANAQTARELMKIFASVLAGKTNSGSGSQFIARDLADTKARVTAALDSDGFRTSTTLDGS